MNQDWLSNNLRVEKKSCNKQTNVIKKFLSLRRGVRRPFMFHYLC